MAARAALLVSPELVAAFSAAQDDLTLRWIKASIDGETIAETARSSYAASTAADFDAMGESLEETVAAFYLFCTDEAPEAGTARHWVIISWVPDLAKVREKMLYSSSRDDLRKTLGMGYFPTDYYANEKSDMTWAIYSKGLERNDAPLSATEQLQKEEAMMERDTSVRSNAMKTIQFEMSEDVKSNLAAFKAGDVNVVELSLTSEETVALASSHTLDEAGLQAIGGLISQDEPRFAFVRYQKSTEQLAAEAGGLFNSQATLFFVYSCPENANLRLKMTYSTAKATLLASASDDFGISFDKLVEVTDTAELDETLAAELSAAAAEAPPGSMQHVATDTKPKRPGRGRGGRRPKKFVADE